MKLRFFPERIMPAIRSGQHQHLLRILATVLFSLGLSVCPFVLRADTIFLKNGKRIVAHSVTQVGDKVYYENEFGRVSLPSSMVDRIEKGGAVPVRRAPSSSPAGANPPPESADLPPAGIRLSLDPGLMDGILVNGVVNDSLIAELAAKAPQSDLDRANAVNAYLLAAVHEARAHRIAEASRWAEQALLTNSFDTNALLLATQLDLTRRQYAEALQHMRTAYGMNQNSPDVLTLLGDAYYFTEGAEQAVRYWKQAYDLRPDPVLKSRIDRVEKEAVVERGLEQAASMHFVLSWQGSPTQGSFGRQVLDALEQMFRELESALDFSPRQSVSVILYGSEHFADITRAPSWAGAINDGKIRVPVQGLAGLTPDLARILKHELTHSFIHQITEARCPTWFNEGMAQFSAAEPLNEFGPTLARRYASGKHIPLQTLEASFQTLNTGEAFLAYGESLAAVQMISERYGSYHLTDLLRALRRGESMPQALHSVLRMTYEDMDREIASYLAGRYGN
jgi:tetratricopeptide (TPR) repeat protein